MLTGQVQEACSVHSTKVAKHMIVLCVGGKTYGSVYSRRLVYLMSGGRTYVHTVGMKSWEIVGSVWVRPICCASTGPGAYRIVWLPHALPSLFVPCRAWYDLHLPMYLCLYICIMHVCEWIVCCCVYRYKEEGQCQCAR